jgi:probable phosphoglycerate mutase
LKQATEVAILFGEIIEGQVFKDRQLREMCIGDAEGKDKNWQSANIKSPPDNNRMNYRIYKNSESQIDVASRIVDFMNFLEKEMPENSIPARLGFALDFVILSWLRIPIENMDCANFRSNPGGVTLLVEDDQFWNGEVSYLNRVD